MLLTIFSVIFILCSSIGTFILCSQYIDSVIINILLALIAFVVAHGLYCVGIMIAVLIKGNKYAKTYDPKDKARWRFMNSISYYVMFWLHFKLHVKGLEKLDKNKTYVFYSNHQNFADVLFYDIVLKDFPRGSMYKKEHADKPLVKGLVKALGGIPIDRSNDREAVKSILEIIKAVKSGVNFMIYPEGTRSRGTKMNSYHPGSFKVAQKAGTDLVVLALDGSYRKTSFLPYLPTHIYVEVVDVISNEDANKMSTIELANHVHDITEQAIEKARKEHKYLKVRGNK